MPGEILRAWNARISSGIPATSKDVQGLRVTMQPHRTHLSLAAHGSRGSSRLDGRLTFVASMRCPNRPSTQGRMNVHNMTLKAVTSRPAIPMERSSLMGTISSAENPIATVVAEMISVRPACLAAISAAGPGSYPSANASRNRLTISNA